jgi:SAM-dependent methyltransferase
MTVKFSDKDEQDNEGISRGHGYPPLPSLESLGLVDPLKQGQRLSGDALPKMGKFRFQLFADWVADNFPPCRVADVGGGKGILTYFLRERGFNAMVIDPVSQPLPDKLKDVKSGKRIRFQAGEVMPRVSAPFEENMVDDFDLIVALHAHGSNVKIIDACAQKSKHFAILPCCVIDEPEIPPPGVNWFSWLSDRARGVGVSVGHFRLNFKGQNIGFYSRGELAE